MTILDSAFLLAANFAFGAVFSSSMRRTAVAFVTVVSSRLTPQETSITSPVITTAYIRTMIAPRPQWTPRRFPRLNQPTTGSIRYARKIAIRNGNRTPWKAMIRRRKAARNATSVTTRVRRGEGVGGGGGGRAVGVTPAILATLPSPVR